MLYWRLAFRNLFRQKARLILNLTLLFGAFAAIVFFKGFKMNVLMVMTDILVETQYGHIQVAKPKLWDNAPIDQISEKMISDPTNLIQKISNLEGVRFVSPRIEFYGLLNSEDKSIPAHFIGFDPGVETQVQKNLFFSEGGHFTQSKQIIIGSGLQKILKVKPGEDLTLVSPTIDGGMNAMDVSLKGVFSTGFAEIDKETVYLPLKDAQKIYDSTAVNRILISLKNPKNLQAEEDKIRNLVNQEGLTQPPAEKLEVRSWRKLADIFNQVEDFYDFQNFTIEFILLLLVLLSVSNTMNMTVFERLGEIGTLRALGDYESDIRYLFFTEAILLGALSILISAPVAFLLMQLISNLGFSVVLPLASQPIPVRLIAYPTSFLEASGVCFFSIVLASLWPAKKGAQTSIVTALRAKI